ncbi:MAG: DUF1080 domain-containing protein [Opitutaceae bacterium]|nr:DUF1080 domain-containing protein [Opitutaceae bacterium]
MNLLPSPRLVFSLLLAALLPLGAADAFKPEPGFVSLFNGRDLTGWCYRDGARTDEKVAVTFDGKAAASDGRFSAKDGVLIVHPRLPRLAQKIWTTAEFPKDFVLRLEFRAAVGADSGIFIRKPQLQCRDYLVAGPDKYKTLKKYRAQDWNEVEITVKDGVAHCTANGEVLEAALKVPATGPIGLEGDVGQMEYRRIRIKELP